MAQYDVDRRSAIVTGGGSGIGEAVARLLAANGASVLVADLDEAAAGRVAEEITGGGGRARAFAVDVSDVAAVDRMIEAAEALAPSASP